MNMNVIYLATKVHRGMTRVKRKPQVTRASNDLMLAFIYINKGGTISIEVKKNYSESINNKN